MTQRQRESIAKYLYDLSKIIFAAAVVGNLLAVERFNMLSFVLGGLTSFVCLEWGYALDGEGEGR